MCFFSSAFILPRTHTHAPVMLFCQQHHRNNWWHWWQKEWSSADRTAGGEHTSTETACCEKWYTVHSRNSSNRWPDRCSMYWCSIFKLFSIHFPQNYRRQNIQHVGYLRLQALCKYFLKERRKKRIDEGYMQCWHGFIIFVLICAHPLAVWGAWKPLEVHRLSIQMPFDILTYCK